MNTALQELGEYVAGALADEVTGTEMLGGELSITIRRDSIATVLKFLRDDANCRFKQLMDICGVDYPENEERFAVIYHLLSLTHNLRIRVKLWTDEDTAVPTVCGLFSSANWWEREAWDMFGILFAGHPDLRRILSDYGFEGHPLRKDFPLTGYVELRYDDEKKRVVYEPVKLQQDFRNFDFLSPWEGIQAALPSEEGADGTAAEDDG
jgi:NADH-quinone oxidoreductase subunit C